jgi:AmmeMemoRadiSam system protein A
MLTADQRRLLLAVARDALRAALGRRPAPQPADLPQAVCVRGGAFVTLKSGDRLRGCLGTFTGRGPLWQTVQEMASAATRDPRFLDEPVTLRELDGITIEISVLSPLEKTTDPMTDVELGRHGICIEGPYGSGCFLPQVATETGWTKEEFFSHCCAGKAGIAPDAWQSPDVTVYRFEAEVFGEDDAGA